MLRFCILVSLYFLGYIFKSCLKPMFLGGFSMSKLTPAMKQYMDIKNKHPDCILLFRMGDFYELFFEDARVASGVLDITLTKRGHLNETEIPLAGIPYHSIEPYLAKLIKAGYKVAICEQLEDPKQAKGVVKRGVTRIVTPGTVMEDRLLDGSCNNYLACIQSDGNNIGMAVVDISTGEFLTYGFSRERLFDELFRFSPSEIVLPSSAKGLFEELNGYFFLTEHDDRHFLYEQTRDTLKEHFGVESLAGFGIDNNKLLGFFKTFRENPNNIRMLCWTNEQVKKWNFILRESDYGYSPEKPFMVGDIVMANDTCLNGNDIIMNNSEEGVIANIREHDKYYWMEIRKELGGFAYCHVLKKDYENDYNEELKAYAKDKNWSSFWALKKFYHDIRHCYSLTCHKSQGSTFTNVAIDIEDLYLNRNIQNRNQLLYVAMTRATDNIWFY